MVKFLEEYWGRKTLRGAALGVTAALASVMPAPAYSSDVKEVGVPSQLPGPGPFIFASAEEARVKVEIIASGLSHAYSLAFLPDGDALIVERGLRLRLLRGATGADPKLIAQPIANIPTYVDLPHLHPDDVLGIQAIALDPDFATNRQIFFTYNKPIGLDTATQRITAATVLARGELDGMRLTKLKDLLQGEAVVGAGGSRILFGRSNEVFVSVGALSVGDVDSAQRTDNIYGKILRISRDGTIPPDNPFVKTAGARPEIWTYGHRDPLGLASARRGQINGTGALLRIVLNDNLQEVRQEILLDSLHQRLKDVGQGPDGKLYVVTDEDQSVVMRIGPAAP